MTSYYYVRGHNHSRTRTHNHIEERVQILFKQIEGRQKNITNKKAPLQFLARGR